MANMTHEVVGESPEGWHAIPGGGVTEGIVATDVQRSEFLRRNLRSGRGLEIPAHNLRAVTRRFIRGET